MKQNLPRVGFIFCDSQCCITEVSTYAIELLCLDNQHVLGKFLPDVCLPLAGNEEYIAEVLHGSRSHVMIDQINVPLSSGKMRYVALSILPQQMGILVIINDVTHYSLQQQQLQQQHHELHLLHEKVTQQNQQLVALNQELTELSQRKSDMLAIATHDLRSPLTAIIGYSDLLLDGDFDPLTTQQQEALQIIRYECDRMLDLIKKFLDLRRLESSAPLHRFAVDFNSLICQVIRSFQAQARLANMRIVYHEVDPSLDRMCTVLGDRDILQQVVANLVSNSIKYAGTGKTVELTLFLFSKIHEAEYALEKSSDTRSIWCGLDVSDNGPGMKEEDVKCLFEPFFRTKEARRGHQLGSGLGLMIVQKAVQQHEGRIFVRSTLGEGTTFTILLPCLQGEKEIHEHEFEQ